MLTALQATAIRVGAGALALLQEPHASLDEVLTTLVNELADVQDDVVVVLDDYHVIVARDVHDRLGFLLEHLPPQIHVVIATRADPALPLPRLRARRDSSKSAPMTCASQPRRPRLTSTTSWGWP